MRSNRADHRTKPWKQGHEGDVIFGPAEWGDPSPMPPKWNQESDRNRLAAQSHCGNPSNQRGTYRPQPVPFCILCNRAFAAKAFENLVYLAFRIVGRADSSATFNAYGCNQCTLREYDSIRCGLNDCKFRLRRRVGSGSVKCS